jgi:hypothetical protein
MTDLAQDNTDYFFSRLDLQKLVDEDRIFFLTTEDDSE